MRYIIGITALLIVGCNQVPPTEQASSCENELDGELVYDAASQTYDCYVAKN